jgi:phospho-N-acetylmuramoyl-pentapeptide-transferase
MMFPPVATVLLGWIGLPFLISVTGCKLFARWQVNRSLGQSIREEGPQGHHIKQGTPTAGGAVILLAWVLSAFLLASPDFWQPEVWLVLLTTLALGAVGLIDDGLKVLQGKNNGIHGYVKLAVQAMAGLMIGLWLWQQPFHGGASQFFNGEWLLPLGIGFSVLAALAVTSTSNAVNLTDGLDGLAATTLIISFVALALILPFSDPLALLCWGAVGAIAGFWPHNKYKAHLFMGDTGSLAFGGLLAAVCLLRGLEWWIVPFGIVFVIEALSVCLQVASFKLTGKRLFKMSPLHHHFELCGWSEPAVVTVFSIVQALGALMGVWLLWQQTRLPL